MIGEKHTLRDWNLGWTAITLGFPEPKTYEQDIPGADGTLDITEAITGGDVKYKNRNISLEFETPDEDFFQWGMCISEIANYLVGKRVKSRYSIQILVFIILEDSQLMLKKLTE